MALVILRGDLSYILCASIDQCLGINPQESFSEVLRGRKAFALNLKSWYHIVIVNLIYVTCHKSSPQKKDRERKRDRDGSMVTRH